MDDRRKEMRKKVMAFTPVYLMEPGKHETLLGFLGDLTLQGAMLIGHQALELGEQIVLGIEFPASLPGVAEKRLTIRAHVARCIHEDDSPDFRLGLEFIEPTPEQIQIIEALLERYYYQSQN